MKPIVLRFARLLAGLFIMSVGITMAYQSGLGLSPWDVLNDGASAVLPITFGQASILIGLVILVIDMLLRERVGFGTFINIVIVGMIVDLIVWMNLIPSYRGVEGLGQLLPRLALCVFSLIPCAYGMYLYMSARLGAGPRDGLMCAITRRSTKVPVGAIRIVLEGLALIGGWLLGGRVGLGTIILVLGNGPVMQLVFKLCKFEIKDLHNETIPETLAAIRSASAAK